MGALLMPEILKTKKVQTLGILPSGWRNFNISLD